MLSSRLVPTDIEMSFEEFLKQYDSGFAEWVNGKVISMSPVSLQHQDISQFLVFILDAYVRQHKLGKVTSAPYQMRLTASSREPDIIFVATEHLGRLKNTYLDGSADLAVEIVSPESGGRDRGEKFYEYEAAGIPEYWLIDPQRQRAEFYQLSADGLYQLQLIEASGKYRSKVVAGFWLNTLWLWQSPLPDALSILRELKLIA
jgi:Uma2 family endonuclease